MSENRTTPFCCHRILPQPPFYKHESYLRAYTCILDFLQFATSFPNYLPQTTLSKTLQQHDFAIRLCKGQADPRYGPNQWGPARYFLHDPDIQGCLVEVIDSPNGNGSSSLETLKMLLHGREGIFGGFLFLEDVWMTVFCPVHSEAIWFLQFWTRGPRDSGHLEEVSKRVRGRLDKEPGFVEDPFTVRFKEMMGIPTRGDLPERGSRERLNMDDVAYGFNTGNGVGKLRDEKDEEGTRQRFWEQRKDLVGFPPGLRPPPDFGPSPSIPPGPAPSGPAPSSFLRQQILLGTDRQEAPAFPPGIRALNRGVDQPGRGGVLLSQHSIEPFVHQPAILNNVSSQGTRQVLLGTTLQWEDSALRAPFTLHPPNLAPPPSLLTPRLGTPQIHSPQPSRSFEMANMWKSPQPHSAQPSFPPQYEIGLEGKSYGTYRPEPHLEPQQQQTQDNEWENISHQIVPGTNRMPLRQLSSLGSPFGGLPHSSRPARADVIIGLNMSKTPTSFPQVQELSQAARLKDTSVPGTSAYPPPAGNTSGLRLIQRQTWDDGNKEWKAYFVWAL